jgi:large repetitive protein
LKPDGTTLASGSYTQCGGDLDVQLPTSGAYTAVVDALGDRAGTLSLTLTQPLGGAITTTDAPLAVTLQPGQDVRKTFDGTAGQWMTFAVSAISSGLSPGCQQWFGSVYLAILKPDGTALVSAYSTQCGADLDVQLPVTGTYTALVDVEARSGSLTVTLSEPSGGPITPTDAPLALTLRPGQDVRKTFSGTPGQLITFAVSGISASLAPGCQQWFQYITVSIVKADGSTLTSGTLTQCGGDLDVQLPVAGTYAAVVDTLYPAEGSLTVTLSDPVGGSISPTDAPLAVTLRPGQDVRKTFSGTAGQWMSFGVSNVSAGLSPGCQQWFATVLVAILKPDGTTLTSTAVTQCGGDIDVQLPVTGAYTALVDAVNAGSGSLTVTLSDAVTATTAINGAPIQIALGRPGQDARLTFDGTSGQQVTVRVTSNTMCTAVTLLKPDGTTLTTTSSCASAFNLATQTLPTSGIYTISSDPNLNTGNHTLAVTTP